MHLDSMWHFIKWLHPFYPPPGQPIPHCSELSLEPSDVWNITVSTWLGIIPDNCCDQSRFLNRRSSVVWIWLSHRSVPRCSELSLCFIQHYAFMLTIHTVSERNLSTYDSAQLIMKGVAVVLHSSVFLYTLF